MTTTPEAKTELVERQKTELAVKESAIREIFKQNKSKLEKSLDGRLRWAAFGQGVMTAINQNEKLLDCTSDSWRQVLTELSTYAWLVGGPLAQAYIVPYKDKATLIPGYRGLIDLVRRSNQVANIVAEVVREGDQFSYQPASKPPIEHEVALDKERSQREPTFVYALFTLLDVNQNTHFQTNVWSAGDIDAHKERFSQGWRRAELGKKDSPWHEHWEVMAKKTVIVDTIKRGLVPVANDHRDMVLRAEETDA